MCWKDQQRGIKAANMGHEVVMAFSPFTYFDYYQAEPIAKHRPLLTALGVNAHLRT